MHDHLVAAALAGLRPGDAHLLAPVRFLLKDCDGLRAIRGRDQRQESVRVLADVGRLPERREQVLETLLVNLVQRERDAEIRRLVLLGDRRGGRVEIGAKAAQVRDHALRSERLQPRDRLGRVGLVVEEHELERLLLAAAGDAAGRIDVFDRDFVAGADLRAARAVAAGEGDDGADLHGLGERRYRSEAEQREGEQGEHLHRNPPVSTVDVGP